MARPIIHHEGLFFEWSTVGDGPVSPAMTRDEFVSYMRDVGRDEDLEARMQRAETQGTSLIDNTDDARTYCAYNRAGMCEKQLSFEKLIELVKRARAEFGLPPLE